MPLQQPIKTRESRRGTPKSATGKYIYAVIEAGAEKSFDFAGINDRPINAIAHGGIALVVSDVEAEKIRPERRHLAAHRAVLSKLMECEEGVLPMRFGAIASEPWEIIRLLSRNCDVFRRQLRRVAGKVEMGLRAFWDVPNIFEYFAKTQRELREMRDRLFHGTAGPSQEERIELGRMFERLLDEERLAHTRLVEEALAPRCSEIIRNRVREEREIMKLACLVEKCKRQEFENAVFETARLFDNNFAFDYNGPWAPHAFAEINLKG